MKKTLYMGLLLWMGMNAWGQNFRFAQMTDIHLSPGNKEHEEDLRNSIQEINAEEGVDFVLITGDISEKGDRETLQRAKELFDTLEPPYYIVMGNHETKWSDSGCTAWQEVFGYERFQMEHKGVHFLGFNTGPLMRMAYGHVVPQDLSWLDEELGKLPKDAPAIIVTHYPLMDGDVDNWYQVTDVLRKYNVRLCVGGHYHALRNLSYDGIPGVLMRSNLRNEEKKSGFGMYEVTRTLPAGLLQPARTHQGPGGQYPGPQGRSEPLSQHGGQQRLQQREGGVETGNRRGCLQQSCLQQGTRLRGR